MICYRFNPELKAKVSAHFNHVIHSLPIRGLQRLAVLGKHGSVHIHKILMDLIVIDRGQVISLLEPLYQQVVESNVGNKTHGVTVARNQTLAQHVAWNLPEPSHRSLVDWKWVVYQRDIEVKAITVRRVKQKLAISFSKIRGDDQHFIKQASQQMLHLIGLGLCRLSARLFLLPVRHPYCYTDRNNRPDSLYPSSSFLRPKRGKTNHKHRRHKAEENYRSEESDDKYLAKAVHFSESWKMESLT